jgi:hypothetical protein
MPQADHHLVLANRLRTTLDYLCQDSPSHCEWIAVAAFYRALHLGEAVLAHLNVTHDRNHVSREKVLKRTTQTQHIWKHYRPLWEASCIARYLAFQNAEYQSFESYLSSQNVVAELVSFRLREIEKSAAKLLGRDVTKL